MKDWDQLLPRLDRGLGSWNEIKQRPYVAFLAPTDGSIPIGCLERFCSLLAEHPALVVKIDDELCSSFKHSNPLTKDEDVTLEREHSTLEGLSSAPWVPCSAIAHETHEANTKEFLPRVVELVQPLDIEITTTSWDPDFELLAVIVEIATLAGIQDKFSEL